jgi:hypothetical protein
MKGTTVRKNRASTDGAKLDELVRQFGYLKTALEEENTFLRRRLAQIEGEWQRLTSDPSGRARHARRAQLTEPPELAPDTTEALIAEEPETEALIAEEPETEALIAEESGVGRSLTRRGALQMLGAAAAGGVGMAIGSTVLSAEPAAATNGGAVLLGEGNAAADGTQVETTVDYGLIGSSTDPAGGGVYGIDGASSSGAYGVRATTINGLGVFSTLTGNGLGAIAGEDQSGQAGSYGVYGSSGSGTGVYGLSNSVAVYGISGSKTGILAKLDIDQVAVLGDCESLFSGVGVMGLANGPFGVIGILGGPSGLPSLNAGVLGDTSNDNEAGVVGSSSGGPGLYAITGGNGQSGVVGGDVSKTGGYGGYFQGGLAPILLVPAGAAGPPTSGTHAQGELYVDANAVLYICTAAGTPGTWQQIMTVPVGSLPTVTAISPTSGPTTGGTTVTITGTNFTGATKVLFGTVAATSFTVVSATEITAVSPAQAAGAQNISVTTPAGTSAAVAADMFTYTSSTVPTVTSISPTSGPIAGGTTVTITGTNFTGATKVVFGTVAATSFTVVSATEITAVSPAQAAGAHNIYVTTPSGTSAPVAADMFTYT